jgi:hypothetical protein
MSRHFLDDGPVVGLVNVAIGLYLAIHGAPRHQAWAGAVNLFLGLALSWFWWNGGGRGRVKRWLGSKSAALLAALTRRMRESAA